MKTDSCGYSKQNCIMVESKNKNDDLPYRLSNLFPSSMLIFLEILTKYMHYSFLPDSLIQFASIYKFGNMTHKAVSIKMFNRSSHHKCSVRKGVLSNVAKSTGKHLCQSLFFNKKLWRQACNFIKKETGTGVFPWILRNFRENIFHRIPMDDWFWRLNCSFTTISFFEIKFKVFLRKKLVFLS